MRALLGPNHRMRRVTSTKGLAHQEFLSWSPRQAAVRVWGVRTDDPEMVVRVYQYTQLSMQL